MEALADADRLAREGVRFAAMGQPEKALASLEEAVRRRPDHATALLHLALGLARAGRFDEAAPRLHSALELRPNSAAFHLFAGQALFQAEQHESAQKEFDRAAQLNPGNDLARSWQTLNRWASGSEDARRQLDPEGLSDSTPFLAQLLALIEKELAGRSVEFVDDERRTQLLDRPRVAYALWRAEMARKAGKLEQAISYADQVLEMQPGHPAAAACLKGCREAALNAARQRVAESPGSAEARLDLAAHLADQEEFEEASRELDEARRLSVEGKDDAALKTPEAGRLTGRILYGLGRIDEALEHVRAGAEPGFSMAETHYYLGLCYLAQGRRLLCAEEFERLVAKAWWVAPLRYREYLALPRGGPRPLNRSEAET